MIYYCMGILVNLSTPIRETFYSRQYLTHVSTFGQYADHEGMWHAKNKIIPAYHILSIKTHGFCCKGD